MTERPPTLVQISQLCTRFGRVRHALTVAHSGGYFAHPGSKGSAERDRWDHWTPTDQNPLNVCIASRPAWTIRRTARPGKQP
jgi:hypothetical protein